MRSQAVTVAVVLALMAFVTPFVLVDITNLLVTVAAVAVMAFLLRRSRGGATSMSVGVAATFGLLALMLGYLWLGFPLWLVGTVLTAVLAVGGLAAVVKFRQVA